MDDVTSKEVALEVIRSALTKLRTIGTTEDTEIDELLTEAEQKLRKIVAKLARHTAA